jgi:transcription antitermination factor NusA-like protein
MSTIGTLTEFIVSRALPSHEAYLVFLPNSGLPALLPKKYSLKQYRVGEVGWGTIFDLDKSYTILSQRAPQYTRKMLEFLISDELIAHNLRIYRVAKTADGTQFKVALKGTGSAQELYRSVQHRKDEIAKYIYGTVYFINYTNKPEEYVKNALLPAPTKDVLKVILRTELNQIDVYVEPASAGIFMGRHGNNVAAASKLIGYSIQIKAN